MNLFSLLIVLFVPFLFAVSVADDAGIINRVQIRPPLKMYSDDLVFYNYPEGAHHRSVRSRNACKFPTDLTDSQVECTLYPSRVKCIQTCVFGSTMRDGIRKEMRCKYDEDKWTPVPKFEECKPFVDCGIKLGPGGGYICSGNYMHKGPKCKIECKHFEDKPAVEINTYSCNIEGNWTPELPFCATARRGMKLVPPPDGDENNRE